MKHMGRVFGSAEQAKLLVIGKDTVYVHTDIKRAEENGEIIEGLFSYNEIQYSMPEYIEIISQESEKMSNEITDTQLALCEIYEAIGGRN